MSSLKHLIFLLGVVFSINSYALNTYSSSYPNQSVDQINNFYDLLNYQIQMGRKEKQQENLMQEQSRLQSIHDFARSTAIRAAMNSVLNNLDNTIQENGRNLDAIYNFSPLMIAGRVVPPVITEARDLYNQTGTDQIRLSKAIYNIDKQAYFSSTAPNWRDYLNFKNESAAFDKFSYLGGELTPKNETEREVWTKATKEGWDLGVTQANTVIEQSMSKLNKDYTGMVRYHLMALRGEINLPVVNNYNLYDTTTSNKKVLSEELLRIEVLPAFGKPNTDSNIRNLLLPRRTTATPTILNQQTVDNLVSNNVGNIPSNSLVENTNNMPVNTMDMNNSMINNKATNINNDMVSVTNNVNKSINQISDPELTIPAKLIDEMQISNKPKVIPMNKAPIIVNTNTRNLLDGTPITFDRNDIKVREPYANQNQIANSVIHHPSLSERPTDKTVVQLQNVNLTSQFYIDGNFGLPKIPVDPLSKPLKTNVDKIGFEMQKNHEQHAINQAIKNNQVYGSNQVVME